MPENQDITHSKPPNVASPEAQTAETELKLLHARQQRAIEQATFLGMTAEEEQDFEKRGLRIREILNDLGKSRS